MVFIDGHVFLRQLVKYVSELLPDAVELVVGEIVHDLFDILTRHLFITSRYLKPPGHGEVPA